MLATEKREKKDKKGANRWLLYTVWPTSPDTEGNHSAVVRNFPALAVSQHQPATIKPTIFGQVEHGWFITMCSLDAAFCKMGG